MNNEDFAYQQRQLKIVAAVYAVAVALIVIWTCVYVL